MAFAVRLFVFLSVLGLSVAQLTNNNCFTCANRRSYKMCYNTKFN